MLTIPWRHIFSRCEPCRKRLVHTFHTSNDLVNSWHHIIDRVCKAQEGEDWHYTGILKTITSQQMQKVASVDVALNEQSYETLCQKNVRYACTEYAQICPLAFRHTITSAGCMHVRDKYRSALPSPPRWQSQLWEVRMLMCLQCVCAYAWLGAPFINKSWVISYLCLFTYKHFLLIHCTISRGAHCPTWICIIHSALYFGVLWSRRQTVRELRWASSAPVH